MKRNAADQLDKMADCSGGVVPHWYHAELHDIADYVRKFETAFDRINAAVWHQHPLYKWGQRKIGRSSPPK